MDKLIFSIPIYARSRQKHNKLMSMRRNNHVKDIVDIWKRMNKPLPEKEIEESENIFNKHQWIPWKYNSIVGYVEIRISFGKLTSLYYFVDAKRLGMVMRNKQICRPCKLYHISNNINLKENEEINRDVNKFLKSLPSLRDRFKSLYFDTESVTNLLPAIDWKVVKNEN